MDTKDKFYKFKGSFIKVSSIYYRDIRFMNLFFPKIVCRCLYSPYLYLFPIHFCKVCNIISKIQMFL